MAAVIEEHDAATESRKRVSERGPFEVFTNTKINRPGPRRPVDPNAVADYFEHSDLAEKHGEQPVREKIAQMVESIQGGSAVTVLFSQNSPGGMSLVHAWFGPNFPLFAHSHPRYGDCLYYVVAGEAILGKRRLGPGAGFFVPNGHPYKYTAGPAGVEVLEFRAGGGEPGAPGMKLDEHSLSSIQRLIERAHENQDSWEAPENIGDTAFRQAELKRSADEG
jgi:hypothetical protein